MKHITTIAIAATLTACAGSPPRSIPAYQAQDVSASCTTLQASAAATNAELQSTYAALKKRRSANTGAAFVGILLFPPLLLATDLHGAQESEIRQLGTRYAMLNTLAAEKDCKALPVMYVEEGVNTAETRKVSYEGGSSGGSTKEFQFGAPSAPAPNDDWLDDTNSASVYDRGDYN